MRYVIDKCRPDAFYHFIRYNDEDSSVLKTVTRSDGTVHTKYDTGWSLYSLQKEEDQQAWIQAVQKFQAEKGITGPTDILHGYIQDVRDALTLEDKKFPEHKDLMMPSVQAIFSLVENPEECDDDFIALMKNAGTAPLPTPKNMIRYAWTAEKYNIKVDIDKAVRSVIENGLSTFVMPVLDAADNMIDTFFGMLNAVYNEVIRIANIPIRIYHNIENLYDKLTDEQQRKELFNQFLEELKKFATPLVEFIYQILCIDVLIETFKALKNLWDKRADVWKSIHNKLKCLVDFDYKSLKSDLINNLAAALMAFIPLFTAMLGAFAGKNCGDKAVEEAEAALLANNLGVGNYDDTSNTGNVFDDLNNKCQEKMKDDDARLRASSIVYKKASDLEDGLSLSCYNGVPGGSKFSPNYKEPTDDICDASIMDALNQPNGTALPIGCKVSMCDTSDPTDINLMLNQNAGLYPEKIIVEISKNLNASLSVSKGQHVKVNDIIGYIEDVPIRAEREFIVDDVFEKYFLGTYFIDSSVFNLEDENIEQNVVSYYEERTKAFATTEYDEVVNALRNQAFAEDYILNYLCYCRFPEFALYTREHVSGSAKGMSTSDFNEEFVAPLEDWAKEFEKDIKKKAGKENAEKQARAGKILSLKKDIDEFKNKHLRKVLKYYNDNPGSIKFCSKGRIEDFLLYDLYSEYMDTDMFKYDEDNPYINRLFNALNTFLGKRLRIEMNLDNIDSLISSFNEVCDKHIKMYWKHNDTNYYDVLATMFEHEFYTNNDTLIEKAEEGDPDCISVYKRVLNYLKSISSFTQDSFYEITTDESTDINKLLEEQGKKSAEESYNKSNKELEDSLKKVARKFVSLRRIEQSMNEVNISTYITDSKFKAAQKLRSTGGKKMDEYIEGVKYSVKDALYGKATVLGPYIQALKKMSTEEATILRGIMTDVVGDFTIRESDPYCINLFKPLLRANWPAAPSLIYNNCNKADWFFFDDTDPGLIPPRTMDDLLKIEQEVAKDISKDTAKTSLEVTDDTIEDADGYPTTKYGYDKFPYWLKYCCMATITHCCLPMYWATGFLIPPVMAPLLLPVIYIPFCVIKGRVTIVMGLGLCGIMPLPMILFVNLGALNGSLIPPINMLVDCIMNLCMTLTNMEDKAITSALAPVIRSLDKEIIELESSRDDIEYQINEIRALSNNHKVKSTFNTLSGIDETTKRGPDTFSSPEAVLDKSSSDKIKEMRKKMKGASSKALETEFTKLINDSIDNMISLDSLSAGEVDRMIARVAEGLTPQ
jgi:hypothetical protein